MKVEIWHNPACSKSREVLALVEESGRTVTIVRYLETTPSAERIEEVLGLLGVEPRALMRTKEPQYRELGLFDEKLTRKQLIEAMVRHPRLIERPVVITERGAVIGRPIENVKKVLSALSERARHSPA